MIGYLIAPNWNGNGNKQAFERLIEPYSSKAEAIPGDIKNFNEGVVSSAENPGGETIRNFFYRGAFKIAVERIELVQQINIEI